MSLSTIGSIAIYLNQVFPVSSGISGNMIYIVDTARQHVANYVGQDIGSNSIEDKYQPAIIDFAKADIIDLMNAQVGESVSLSELSVNDSNDGLSAEQYRMLGEMKLKSLGRSYTFLKSLS